jgi:hypothetical protein
MFKRFGSLVLMAALALGATAAAAAAPDVSLHVISAAAPGDFVDVALMASSVLGAPMRAKFVVASVDRAVGHEGNVSAERVKFNAVCPPSFDKDGLHEDSTFSRYSPQASCEIYINNPALHGKYAPGQKFYVDFTPAPAT